MTLKQSPVVFLKWLALIELLVPVTAAVITLVVDLLALYSETELARQVDYSLLAVLVYTGVRVLLIGLAFAAWYVRSYRVTAESILERSLNSFEVRELAPTQAITAIRIRQSRLARAFDYGTLEITTEGSSIPVRLSNIPNPAYHARRIQGMVEPKDEALGAKGMALEEIIAAGEGQYVEFKSSLAWDYRRQMANKALREPVMKNVVGFMNTSGGVVLIGVADDGEVLGIEADFLTLRKQDVDGWENSFNLAFSQMVGAEYRQHLDVAFETVSDKTVCLVAVRPSSRPVFLRQKGSEEFYIRTGNSSQPLSISQATTYIQSHFGG